MKVMLTSDTHYGTQGNSASKQRKFWRKVGETIEKEGVKLLIMAGDMASHRQRHLLRTLELVNEYVKCEIVLVRGNHDLWDGEDKKDKAAGTRSLNQIWELHRTWFKHFHIHHLEDGPLVIDDVLICGFDGWYATSNPATNDKHWMPELHEGCPIMPFLTNRAWKKFEECLDLDTSKYRKSILVTHHNPYPFSPYKDYKPRPVKELLEQGITYTGHGANIRFLPEIAEKFDVLCCGHTHGYKNDTTEGIQIYNSGSDYNNPKFLIFEI